MACPYDIHVYISQEFSIVNNILFKTAVHLCGSLFQSYIMWPFIFPNRKIAYTLVNKYMKISTYEYENHHSNPIPRKKWSQTCSIFWALSSNAFWKGVISACFFSCCSLNTFLSLCFSMAFCNSVFWFSTLTPLQDKYVR